MAHGETVHSSYPGDAEASRRRLLHWFGGALTASTLAACAKPPPPPVVTPVRLALVGGSDLNPDARGRASPVMVRVYALKTTASFDSADFFALFEKDTATLGADLHQREETLLRPGERKLLTFTLPAEVTSLGILAAYRDLARATWRQIVPLKVGTPTDLTAMLGARGIVMQKP